ncbi:histidine phosphatase family protein [Ktedonospora formicarum]|uniref:Phosphoglycerate mutase n=1 Tax=Ktedonospora formicarum TaxID=2778364 RepID=A0A8J3HYA3_9CHLR|nr:histidine phosphatase family protein [Ktedonospora formicarum]GHO44176.1 phosphoglycerate mutase [Ktedonospora formicarum]
MTTQLYLIRHGEATSQVHDIIRDDGLTSIGVRQAERLRDRLLATHEIQADVLIASTFLRARQTAQIIAPALNLPIIFDDEVQELRDGEAYGLTYEERRERFGPPPDFLYHPFQKVAPGGENWPAFSLRVATALERITREHAGKTIVIVCHGGVIDTAFSYFFHYSSFAMPVSHFSTQNTSITQWRLDEKRGQIFWRLIRYNDNMHVWDMDADVDIPWSKLAPPTRRPYRNEQPDVPATEE